MLLLLALFATGCTENESPRPQAKREKESQKTAPLRPARCPEKILPSAGSRVKSDQLQEISGIVASRESPDLFWLHNDSGDAARIYALQSDGHVLGSVELPLTAIDFEDIALEKRDGAPDRIYVADTGDNLATRIDGILIHRVEEPTRASLRLAGARSLSVNSETMRLHFPDGPKDAEALLVDSDSGEIVLITKPHMAPPEIYGVSGFTREATLTHWGTITPQSSGYDFQIVTAADLSADGRWILLRSYTDILAFPRAPNERISDALLGKGCPIEPAHENQGEAIAFLDQKGPGSHGRGKPTPEFPKFVTIGEGAAQLLHFYRGAADRDMTGSESAPWK